MDGLAAYDPYQHPAKAKLFRFLDTDSLYNGIIPNEWTHQYKTTQVKIKAGALSPVQQLALYSVRLVRVRPINETKTSAKKTIRTGTWLRLALLKAPIWKIY